MGRRRLVLGFLGTLAALFLFTSPSGAVSKKVTSPLLQKSTKTSDEPIHLNADRLEYFKEEDLYIAQGSVVATQGPLRIEADYLTLNQTTGTLLATGDVHFTDGENKVDADQIELDVNTQLGVLFDTKMFIKSDNYHIEGEEMERRDVDRYDLKDASFTACDCEEHPDWRVRARQLRLHLDHYLVARDVVFYVDEVPVLYLPYFLYPAKTKRQTGLLVARFGYSNRHGFRYDQSLFWAISKNQDATISLDHRGKLGDGGGLEYRYLLSNDSGGKLQTSYFHDTETQVGRWDLSYVHQQRFGDRITAKLNLHYVNQKNNFLQLSDVTAERAQQNIESDFFLTYRGEESFAYILARYTLSLTAQNNDTTLQKLPEVGYSLTQHRLGESPVFFNFESSAVNYWRVVGLRAQRADIYPKVSMPVLLVGTAMLTPWAGFRETAYSRGTVEDKPITREIYPMGINLEDRFYGEWGGVTHLISPQLMYEYIPVEDHSDIPQFDDLDRLHDRNSITLSLGQRLIGVDEKGGRFERIALRLTETYNIQEARSGIPGRRPYSDLRGEGSVHPFSRFEVRVDSFYSHYNHEITSWNTDINFNAASFLTLTVGQRYTRAGDIPQKGDLFNPLYIGDRELSPRIVFWTEKAVIRTPWGISLASRAYYDADKNKFVEIDYGLRYERQCWGVTLAYLDLRDRNDFIFMVTLKGLGGTETKKFIELF